MEQVSTTAVFNYIEKLRYINKNDDELLSSIEEFTVKDTILIKKILKKDTILNIQMNMVTNW